MRNEITEKLAELQWLWHKRHMARHAHGGVHADTTRGQGRILALLKIQDGISAKDIAYLLGVRVSSLNELLAKLEKNEYITREQSEDDGRIILVRLTEKGRTEEHSEKQGGGDSEFPLSEEEKIVFSGLLDKVIAALYENLGIDSEEAKEIIDEWRERKAEMRKFRERHGHTHSCNCGHGKKEEK